MPKSQTQPFTSKVETITPKVAEEYFSQRALNRKFRPRLAQRYASMMEHGEWIDFHPEGIVFNHEHQLIDGQHRMAAIMQVGIPFHMPVVRYKTDVSQIMPTLNRGISRTPRDILGIAFGEPNFPSWHASIVRSLCLSDNMTNLRGSLSDHDLIEMWDKHGQDIQDVCAAFKSKVRLYTRGPIVAAFTRAYIFYKTRSGQDLANRVLHAVSVFYTGIPSDVQKDKAMIVFRNWIIKQLSGQTKHGGSFFNQELYLRGEKAIYHYMTGKGYSRADIAKKELFPMDLDKKEGE